MAMSKTFGFTFGLLFIINTALINRGKQTRWGKYENDNFSRKSFFGKINNFHKSIFRKIKVFSIIYEVLSFCEMYKNKGGKLSLLLKLTRTLKIVSKLMVMKCPSPLPQPRLFKLGSSIILGIKVPTVNPLIFKTTWLYPFLRTHYWIKNYFLG